VHNLATTDLSSAPPQQPLTAAGNTTRHAKFPTAGSQVLVQQDSLDRRVTAHDKPTVGVAPLELKHAPGAAAFKQTQRGRGVQKGTKWPADPSPSPQPVPFHHTSWPADQPAHDTQQLAHFGRGRAKDTAEGKGQPAVKENSKAPDLLRVPGRQSASLQHATSANVYARNGPSVQPPLGPSRLASLKPASPQDQSAVSGQLATAAMSGEPPSRDSSQGPAPVALPVAEVLKHPDARMEAVFDGQHDAAIHSTETLSSARDKQKNSATSVESLTMQAQSMAAQCASGASSLSLAPGQNCETVKILEPGCRSVEAASSDSNSDTALVESHEVSETTAVVGSDEWHKNTDAVSAIAERSAKDMSKQICGSWVMDFGEVQDVSEVTSQPELGMEVRMMSRPITDAELLMRVASIKRAFGYPASSRATRPLAKQATLDHGESLRMPCRAWSFSHVEDALAHGQLAEVLSLDVCTRSKSKSHHCVSTM
jgi:hypothetical protein